jgi:signal transduction histidine kinase
MSPLGTIYSFRTRIAMVLILSLIVATAMLYKLNQRAETNIIAEVDKQKIDLTKAINVAQQSLTSQQYISAFLQQERSRDANDSHVQRILVVDSQGIIDDSSDADDIGKHFEDLNYGTFQGAIDFSHQQTNKNPYKIYTFPLQTRSTSDMSSDNQLTYILIIFSDDLTEELRTSSFNRLVATASVLLFSIIVSLILILQFTRPVGQLVEAAQGVAAGNFDVRIEVKRRDELGHLSEVFNEMVKGLRERRELEARLYRAEQSAIVGRLASGIAHEVKNPLNYISLTIDYLRSKYAPAAEDAREKFTEKMDGIKDEIKRLDRLIRNFLSYGRPLNLNLKPIGLRDLIGNILNLTAEQADQQAIRQQLDKTTTIPNVDGDVERLRSCFSNLIMNAQQAMAEGGELKINFEPKDEGVEVVITDTGSGIAPENIEKIFEPYFSTKDTGTGLGLALVKRIIEGHGGRIEVESQLNQGTTFRVWLPVHPPAIVNQSNDLQADKLASLPAI